LRRAEWIARFLISGNFIISLGRQAPLFRRSAYKIRMTLSDSPSFAAVP